MSSERSTKVIFFGAARLRAYALCWIAVSCVALLVNYTSTCVWSSQRSCTADFPLFAISAWMAVHGHARDAYDLILFQARVFAMFPHARDVYQFAYPPFVMLLTAPLGLLPYWAGWWLWMVGGWLAFALCVRRQCNRDWLIYCAALPAVFVNILGSQNGFWSAAFTGWGLLLLPRRPFAAGAVLALLCCKPQIALLVPIALLAGRHWRALVGFCVCAVCLSGAASLVYGIGIWHDFMAHNGVVRALILENGQGISHRMLSALVLLVHLGIQPRAADAAQAAVSLGAAAWVAYMWRGSAPVAQRDSSLVLGMVLAAPYLFDYDLAMLALVPVWLRDLPATSFNRLAMACLVILPVACVAIAATTGLPCGIVVILPAIWLVTRFPIPDAA